MSKIRKDLKKVVAGILSVTLVAGSVHMLGSNSSTVQAANVPFGNPVLKIGVMSDLHLNRGTYTSDQIKSKVTQYAKGVGTLEAMSGDGLDVLMLGGDYTNNGSYEQGKTFASATKAILEEINKEKDDKTQLLLTYGNHDTEWEGQMSYTEWENLLQNEYGLLSGITYGPKDSGCYKYTRTINEKTYYFYSVETEKYSSSSSNAFRTDVLEWLDVELASTPKDAYVYVISHAPIVESGVYGADVSYCKNAGWASAYAGETSTVTRADQSQYEVSGNIHDVLKGYPQVVYMSGHTHYTNTLESSIMSDMYTAITVSAFNTGDLYNEKSNYLDTIGDASKPGYSLYIEVDESGNQRITRVNTEASTVVSVEVVGESGTSAVNSQYGTFVTSGVSITKKTEVEATTLAKQWIMAAPNANGTHLETYKASTRTENPVFRTGSLELSNISTGTNGDSLSFDFSFPTAFCSESYVIRYEISIYDQNERCIDSRWILGNWTTNTDGCNDGYNHTTAEKLSYSLSYTSEQLGNITGLTAKLVAVNEFGGRSELTWDDNGNPSTVLLKPSASGANKNLFDGMTTGQVYSYHADYKKTSGYSLTKSKDEKGVITTSINTTSATTTGTDNQKEEVVFWTDKDKYEYGQQVEKLSLTYLGNAAQHASKATTIEEEDTFVYETEFKVTSEKIGNLYFAFRTNDSATTNAQRSVYTGVLINGSHTYLYLFGNSIKGSHQTGHYDFKLTEDNKNTYHKLTIVSAPNQVSVWIDDKIVFDNICYNFSQTQFALQEDGSYQHAYSGSKVCVLGNINMVPMVSMYIENTDVTLTNQYLYLYDTKDQVADELKALDVFKEYYDSSKITWSGQVKDTGTTIDEVDYSNPVIIGNNITAYAKHDGSNGYTQGHIEQNISSDFAVEDTVVLEFDYTPSNISTEQYGDMYVRFRSDGTNHAQVLVRSTGISLFYFKDAATKNISFGSNRVVDGTKVHVKIVSDNKKVSIYFNNVCALKDYKYQSLVTTCDTSNMKPVMRISLRNALWKLENISLRSANTNIENTAALTNDNNLLKGEYSNITSSYNTKGYNVGNVVNGTNIYADVTPMNLEENNITNYKLGETFYPFGNKNSNYTMGASESFVMSTFVRVSNQNLDSEKYDCNHRLGMELATYDDTQLWYFIEETTLKVYGVGDSPAQIDLNTLCGYEVGDYIRLTSAVSPYGVDIYIDGVCVYSYDAGYCKKIEYSPTFVVSGVEARILDASVHYNYDNGELYYQRITKSVDVYENLEGVYLEDKDAADAVVAQVKSTCENFVGTSNKALSQYATVIEKLIADGKVVNNVMSDNLWQENLLDLDNANTNADGTINILNQTCAFKKGETWVFKADITCTSHWNISTRVGFGISASNKPDVMVQGNSAYATYTTGVLTPYASTVGDTFQTGDKWHICYIVKPLESIKTILTQMDGTVIYEDTTPVAWTSIKSLSNITDEAALANATFTPYFYARRVDTKFENIYVGRDLSADITSLNTQITAAKGTDTSTSTYISVTAMEEKLANATAMSEKIVDYVGESVAPILTTPYSKDEMNAAESALNTAVTGLVTATEQLTVGDDTTGVRSIGVASGDVLPKNCYINDKYIIGWTVNGEAAANDVTYTGDAATNYVADYVDTDMLEVKCQSKSDTTHSTAGNQRWNVRFFGSVNNLNYKNAGIVLSVKNPEPEVGGAGCSAKTTTTVYESVLANGETVSVKGVYAEGNSRYMFARVMDNIPDKQVMYARAYVTLDDEAGTIVYGTIRAITVDSVLAE